MTVTLTKSQLDNLIDVAMAGIIDDMRECDEEESVRGREVELDVMPEVDGVFCWVVSYDASIEESFYRGNWYQPDEYDRDVRFFNVEVCGYDELGELVFTHGIPAFEECYG